MHTQSSHRCQMSFFFFFNDTATTEIYTLSLHDALPIYTQGRGGRKEPRTILNFLLKAPDYAERLPLALVPQRSEEHTSELQSRSDLVCRLLLEKKKNSDCPHSRRGRPLRQYGNERSLPR